MSSKVNKISPVAVDEVVEYNENSTSYATAASVDSAYSFKYKIKKGAFNYLCSITFIGILVTTILILLTGGSILMISIIFSVNSLNNSVKYKKNEISTIISERVQNYITLGPKSISYFKELESIHGNGKNEYSLSNDVNNPSVVVLGENYDYFKSVSSYIKSKDIFYGRYAEPTNRAIALLYYPDTGGIMYVSFPQDKSIHYSSIRNYEVNSTKFAITVPPGYYSFYGRDWYNISKSTLKPSWLIYFNGGDTKAISYSEPIFFQNETFKGIMNVCFKHGFSNVVLKEVINEFDIKSHVDIILLESNGDIISSTINKLNTSILVWNEGKGVYESEKVNIKKYDGFYSKLYTNYVKGKLSDIGSRYVKYDDINLEDSNKWILITMLKKSELQAPFIIVLIIQIVVYISGVFISSIVVVGFMSLILLCIFIPLNSRMKDLNNFSQKRFKPRMIFTPIELFNLYRGFITYDNIQHTVINWLPPEVIRSLVTDQEIKSKGEDITIMFIDIKEFTKKTGDKSPKFVVNFINDFVTQMEKIVFPKPTSMRFEQYKNCVVWDKLIGDEVMLYIRGDQSRNIAFDIAERIMKNKKLEVRIGINFGSAIIGVVGKKRKQFTILAESVNVASRLIAACKDQNLDVAFTEKVHDGLNVENLQNVRFIGKVSIRGTEGNHDIYSIHYS